MSSSDVLVAAAAGVGAGPWLRGLMVAHAVPYGQPLRTTCTGCGYPAVPVGWRGVAAVAPPRGRCPACTARVGPVPGVVEVVAAVLLAGLALRAPHGWVLAGWAWAGLLGLVLAVLDAAVLRLPDPLTLAAALGTGLALSAAAITTGHYGNLLRAVVCALVLAAVYLMAVLAPGTGMGRGDAQLALVIGLCLGWVSVTAVITATVAAVLLAGAHVAVQLVTGRIRRADPVPFGPFMLIGALTALILTT
jgi:leader peptidase (prepilin peptidase)/N-methyltransferase